MFDDLRNSANDQVFQDEGNGEVEPLLKHIPSSQGKGFKLGSLNFLGLTAVQRFVLSALLFLLVIILGFMLVMITSSTLST